MRKRVLTTVVPAALFAWALSAPPAVALPSEAIISQVGSGEKPAVILSVHARVGDQTPRQIRFTRKAESYLISDAAGIVPRPPPDSEGPDCSQLDAETVSCPIGGVVLRLIQVITKGGADLIDLRDTLERTNTLAGSGDDQVLTGARLGKVAHRASGRRGADVLIGSVGRDTLEGGPGADNIHTGGGAAFPRRFFTVNQVRGGPGADRIFGGPSRDSLLGDPGIDLLVGGLGEDEISGGRGNDTIRSRDGRPDGISCGPGNPRRQRAIRDRRERPLNEFRWPAGKPWADQC